MRMINKIIAVAAIIMFMGCGGITYCDSYTPYELDWNGYNSVKSFVKYFSGYEETIHEHIGDTVRVYGCTFFKLEPGYVQQMDNSSLLKTFFDDSGTGYNTFVLNDYGIEIPLSFYEKTLYVTGTIVYYPEMGCHKGTGLQLISIDTIPQ